MNIFGWRLGAALAGAAAFVACDAAQNGAAEVVAAAQPAPDAPAASIFFGGPIYTGVDGAAPAEAVATADGRIVYVGDREGADAYIDEATRLVDLDGHALYPGFVDAHAHLYGVGSREQTLNLEGVASLADMLEIVAARAAEAQPNEVIVGRGWIETHWPEGRFPTADDLDSVAPNNPVLLRRADGHAMVVNHEAMLQVWVNDSIQNPDGGEYLRDDEGRLTGMVIDAAMARFGGLFGSPTDEERRATLKLGAEVYAAYGWTGMHNMSVGRLDLAQIEGLAEDGELPIRVVNALDVSLADYLFQEGAHDVADGRAITRGLKAYMDGALGSRGAALHEPYADRPDSSGLATWTEEDALPVLEEALRQGVQMHVHAIGDRGNTYLLDWIEEAYAAVPEDERAIAEPRWRDEHTQILRVDDIPRFAELGVIPSMQPSHAIGDLHFAPARLGQDRLAGAYAWRALIDAGSIIAGGSDAPVERGDPMIEFYAAVARKSLDGFSGEGWHPEQAVTREEALKMFTAWPAYASFQEDDLGTIEVGKRADFSSFTADIMTIPEDEIPEQSAYLTVVAGEIVFRAED